MAFLLFKGGGFAEDSEAGGSQQHHRQAEGDRTQYLRPRRQSWPRIQVPYFIDFFVLFFISRVADGSGFILLRFRIFAFCKNV